MLPGLMISFAIYETLEMFKVTFNNYSMLKLRFFLIKTDIFAGYCENVSH